MANSCFFVFCSVFCHSVRILRLRPDFYAFFQIPSGGCRWFMEVYGRFMEACGRFTEAYGRFMDTQAR